MSQINILVNTEDNSLSVSVNGATVTNVTDANTYRDVDSNGNVTGFYVRIVSKEMVSPDLAKVVEYFSFGSPQAQAAIASGLAIYRDDLPDFVGLASKTQVQKDIAKFFEGK